VRRKNTASAIAKHGAAKLPAVLPEVPPREHNKRTKLQNIISAGRKDAVLSYDFRSSTLRLFLEAH
jgi:hypothetical protein